MGRVLLQQGWSGKDPRERKGTRDPRTLFHCWEGQEYWDIGTDVVENSMWEGSTWTDTSMWDLQTMEETPGQPGEFMWHIPTQATSEDPPKWENVSAVTSEGAGTWGDGLLSLMESWNYGIS